MMKSCAKIRRARPLLGTRVEIMLEGAAEPALQAAASRAFAEIARIERLMNFHAQDSGLSRLNREASLRAVVTDAEIWRVLAIAAQVSRATDGAFDVSAVSRTALSDPCGSDGHVSDRASFRDVELLAGNRVRFHRPLAIDLGGIAKGFAVDCAVAALMREAPNGCVNAGGDLRAFGEWTVPVHVRDPSDPGRIAARTEICNRALATSAIYREGLAPTAGCVRDPRGNALPRAECSASVRGPACAVVDALAKAVLLLRERAASALAQFDAQAFVLDADGARTIGARP